MYHFCMNTDDLKDKILFSKEAAQYLGITTQRLNKLVSIGKIKPIKKNSAGTIFHIDELNKRKEELSFFEETKGGSIGMFKIDSKVKQEALNFATLMNATGRTEHALEKDFEVFSNYHEVDFPIPSMVDDYAIAFNVDKTVLLMEYKKAENSFSTLRESDEIIKRGDSDYPPLLSSTNEAPRFLYIRGNKSLLYEKRTVALVGARNASDKAKDNTKRLALELGKNGITIVSGLAKGIDVTAHRTALEHHFNTIAVIGTNLNQYYPLENKEVQLQIENRGLIVSQFPPSLKTQRWFFPLRNGVMSGLSLATVIMEASETSGALKQADFALKQHRQIIIPKNVLASKTVTWPRKYVEKGAEVVEKPSDVYGVLARNEVFQNKEVAIKDSVSTESLLIDEVE